MARHTDYGPLASSLDVQLTENPRIASASPITFFTEIQFALIVIKNGAFPSRRHEFVFCVMS
jgi:hypothetical protein